jgi:cation diffusion facilitator family transporter
MSDCCDLPSDNGADGNDPAFRRVLQKCLAANASLFVVEIVVGVFARSLSLLADAVDFFSDSVGLGLGLFAAGRSARFRSKVALFNALTMAAVGLGVIIEAALRFRSPVVPQVGLMGGVSVLAFTANFLCTWWLYRHRGGDSLQQSLWLCSRNDALNNVGVMAAAGLIAATGSPWPDMAVAVFILIVEMQSAYKIARKALGELTI